MSTEKTEITVDSWYDKMDEILREFSAWWDQRPLKEHMRPDDWNERFVQYAAIVKLSRIEELLEEIKKNTNPFQR